MTLRAIPVIAVALVVGVLADLPFDAPLFPGYNAVIGLGGTILLVVVAKKVLSPLVDRDETYDVDDVPPDVQHDVWGARADDVAARGSEAQRAETPRAETPGSETPGADEPGGADV